MARWRRIASGTETKRGKKTEGKVRYRKRVRVGKRKLSREVRRPARRT